MEEAGIFYGHLFFPAIWSILWPFCICFGHLLHFVVILWLHFFPFWYVVPRQIWQPWKQLAAATTRQTEMKRICN
jgi:hypothetical protein